MNTGPIVSRYAAALLCYASDTGADHDVYCMMKRLSEYFTEVPHLEKTFCDGMVPARKRKDMFLDLFRDYSPHSLQVLSGFLDLLIRHQREHVIRWVCLQYLDKYRQEQGITSGVLTTVVPVDEITAEKIKEILDPEHPQKVELELKQDKQLIGGFLLRVGMKVWDASLAGRIREVRKAFGITDKQ
ncbi:MAG TPA: ATP synthase F1 subunit delta [Bacteroidales bacterium]|nr:ATP synthase F1 subunit delta [Bacteroidales bacterium]HRW95705.1 ATP synthase F1 subunit delta [Bacteroidales bacterium]